MGARTHVIGSKVFSLGRSPMTSTVLENFMATTLEHSSWKVLVYLGMQKYLEIPNSASLSKRAPLP